MFQPFTPSKSCYPWNRGDPERAHGSLRIRFGRFNTMDDIEAITDALNEIVSKLREISAIGTG